MMLIEDSVWSSGAGITAHLFDPEPDVSATRDSGLERSLIHRPVTEPAPAIRARHRMRTRGALLGRRGR